MKRFTLIIATLLLFVITSCGSSNRTEVEKAPLFIEEESVELITPDTIMGVDTDSTLKMNHSDSTNKSK